MTLGIGVRDVADFMNWYLLRYEPENPKVTNRNAWSRHRQNGHFEVKPRVEKLDGTALSLDELVDDLFSAWQAANKGVTPSARELREWLKLRASIRTDIERREGGKQLDEMLMNAGYKEETDALRPTDSRGQ